MLYIHIYNRQRYSSLNDPVGPPKIKWRIGTSFALGMPATHTHTHTHTHTTLLGRSLTLVVLVPLILYGYCRQPSSLVPPRPPLILALLSCGWNHGEALLSRPMNFTLNNKDDDDDEGSDNNNDDDDDYDNDDDDDNHGDDDDDVDGDGDGDYDDGADRAVLVPGRIAGGLARAARFRKYNDIQCITTLYICIYRVDIQYITTLYIITIQVLQENSRRQLSF